MVAEIVEASDAPFMRKEGRQMSDTLSCGHQDRGVGVCEKCYEALEAERDRLRAALEELIDECKERRHQGLPPNLDMIVDAEKALQVSDDVKGTKE
jgi:hypothetical protein